MPKAFTDCVSNLTKSGKSKDSAYAICVSSYMKKHGKSPFKNEQELIEEDLPLSIYNALFKVTKESSFSNVRLAIAVLEGIASDRKAKIVNDIV